jgi:hypothetical protein
VLKKQGWVALTGFIWLRIRASGGVLCEHGNESSSWFQASAAMLMRSALFRGVTQRRGVIHYRRSGKSYRSHLQRSLSLVKLHWISWPLKMGPIRYPETSVKDCHSTLRNTPEAQKFHKVRGFPWLAESSLAS